MSIQPLVCAREKITHSARLHVLDLRPLEDRPAHGVHLREPAPPGRRPVVRLRARVVRPARAGRAHEQQHRPKRGVVQVRGVRDAPPERRRVQERQVHVHVVEVAVDQLLHEVCGRERAVGGPLHLLRDGFQNLGTRGHENVQDVNATVKIEYRSRGGGRKDAPGSPQAAGRSGSRAYWP